MEPVPGRGGTDELRVAIAHDYLTQRGGAEKVVLSMSRAFPDAAIHTLLYDPANTYPDFAKRDVRVSGLNRVGVLRRHHRAALPVLASAARSMYVDADVVLVSSSGWAHGFRSSGRKLVFCHTPAHWLYVRDQYLGDHPKVVERAGLAMLSRYLKRWDRRAALACDGYLANSTMIRKRIGDVYGIAADVVHAPFAPLVEEPEPVEDVLRWLGPDADRDHPFYLCIARLLPYKHVDRVVRAFAGSERRLVVVGTGPERKRISALTSPNVLMAKDLSHGQMTWLYQRCRALITASYEDYGLTPIEAASQGKPTVALRWGGFLDTVAEGVTGVFFDRPEPDDIARALDRFEASAFDADEIRRHAEQFSEKRFAERLRAAVRHVADH